MHQNCQSYATCMFQYLLKINLLHASLVTFRSSYGTIKLYLQASKTSDFLKEVHVQTIVFQDQTLYLVAILQAFPYN
jgi:hypothetical protein